MFSYHNGLTYCTRCWFHEIYKKLGCATLLALDSIVNPLKNNSDKQSTDRMLLLGLHSYIKISFFEELYYHQ